MARRQIKERPVQAHRDPDQARLHPPSPPHSAVAIAVRRFLATASRDGRGGSRRHHRSAPGLCLVTPLVVATGGEEHEGGWGVRGGLAGGALARHSAAAPGAWGGLGR
jgi:hypothetical protein